MNIEGVSQAGSVKMKPAMVLAMRENFYQFTSRIGTD
jgi:hypothetical protein